MVKGVCAYGVKIYFYAARDFFLQTILHSYAKCRGDGAINFGVTDQRSDNEATPQIL
jgi:hypothetical protein